MPVVISVIYIGILVWRTQDAAISFDLGTLPRPNRNLTILYLALLAVNVAAVLHYLDKWLVLGLTVAVCVLLNWRLLLQVDYGLLLTFVGFFIFIGNIQHTEFVVYLKNSLLGTLAGKTFPFNMDHAALSGSIWIYIFDGSDDIVSTVSCKAGYAQPHSLERLKILDDFIFVLAFSETVIYR